MTVLDMGCGPGSITVGLAAAVAPGRAIGVDQADDVPPGSVRGDVTCLPFANGSFDAVFAHAVLQHLPDPLLALREARRVARPGAVIGVADADWDGALQWPTNELLERGAAISDQLRGGTNRRVGKRLRSRLHEADFERAEARVTASAEGTAPAAAGMARFQSAFFAALAVVDHVVAGGWSTEEEMQAISAAWTEWGQHPGAFAARFWCEAVAWAG